MIYLIKPDNFNSQGEGSGCFIECNGKFLMLKRSATKNWAPSCWGLPSGKIELNESPLEAVIRETREESGIILENPDYLHILFVKFKEAERIYHVFKKEVGEIPEVLLSDEHTEYRWFTPEESLKFPLVENQDRGIKLIYNL